MRWGSAARRSRRLHHRATEVPRRRVLLRVHPCRRSPAVPPGIPPACGLSRGCVLPGGGDREGCLVVECKGSKGAVRRVLVGVIDASCKDPHSSQERPPFATRRSRVGGCGSIGESADMLPQRHVRQYTPCGAQPEGRSETTPALDCEPDTQHGLTRRPINTHCWCSKARTTQARSSTQTHLPCPWCTYSYTCRPCSNLQAACDHCRWALWECLRWVARGVTWPGGEQLAVPIPHGSGVWALPVVGGGKWQALA